MVCMRVCMYGCMLVYMYVMSACMYVRYGTVWCVFMRCIPEGMFCMYVSGALYVVMVCMYICMCFMYVCMYVMYVRLSVVYVCTGSVYVCCLCMYLCNVCKYCTSVRYVIYACLLRSLHVL